MKDLRNKELKFRKMLKHLGYYDYNDKYFILYNIKEYEKKYLKNYDYINTKWYFADKIIVIEQIRRSGGEYSTNIIKITNNSKEYYEILANDGLYNYIEEKFNRKVYKSIIEQLMQNKINIVLNSIKDI